MFPEDPSHNNLPTILQLKIVNLKQAMSPYKLFNIIEKNLKHNERGTLLSIYNKEREETQIAKDIKKSIMEGYHEISSTDFLSKIFKDAKEVWSDLSSNKSNVNALQEDRKRVIKNQLEVLNRLTSDLMKIYLRKLKYSGEPKIDEGMEVRPNSEYQYQFKETQIRIATFDIAGFDNYQLNDKDNNLNIYLKSEANFKCKKEIQNKYFYRVYLPASSLSGLAFGVFMKGDASDIAHINFYRYFSFTAVYKCLYNHDPLGKIFKRDSKMSITTNLNQNRQGLGPSSEGLIEIFLRLFNMTEMMVQISIKFIEQAYVFTNQKSKNNTIYLHMNIPPKLYVHFLEKGSYEHPQVREHGGWKRIHNFLILEPREKFGENELLGKIFYNNNTVIKLSFNAKEDTENKMFSLIASKLKAKGILKEKSLKIQSYHLSPSRDFLGFQRATREFREKFEKGPRLFEVQYYLLVMLSNSRMNVSNIQYILPIILNLSDHEVSIETLKLMYSKLKRKVYGLEFKNDDEEISDFFKSTYDKLLSSKKIWKRKENPNLCFTRRLSITPSGFIYGLEEPEASNRVTRDYINHESRFLRLTFSDDFVRDVRMMDLVTYGFFKQSLLRLLIVDRQYKFLAYSSSQIRGNSAWFVAELPEERFTAKAIRDRLGDFSNIKIPAKYAARIGQAFSASYPLLLGKNESISVINEKDIKADNGKEFSDGIGRIPKEMIVKIRRKLKKQIISAVQIRYGGAKGVLVYDPDFHNPDPCILNMILRESMIKYKADDKELKLELLEYNKYRSGYLNRQIIMLLLSNGVSPDNIWKLYEDYANKLDKGVFKDANIYNYMLNMDFEDVSEPMANVKNFIRTMMNIGIDGTKDPFIAGIFSTFRTRGFLQLKEKCNLFIEKAARLMGVLDEYGVLEADEVYFKILPQEDDEKKAVVITGDVIITRNPCLHPGDIRKVKAVDKSDRLGHLTNCLVLPRKGEMPLSCMMAGGDLDGDLYFISWEELLLPEKVAEPMNYVSNLDPVKRDKVNEEDIIDFFLDYINNENLGRIDNSHLALADKSEKYANDEKCLELAKHHSDAVDFAKTGFCPVLEKHLFATEWPDYMEKEEKYNTYPSKTVIGEIYRDVLKRMNNEKSGIEQKEPNPEYNLDSYLVYPGWEKYIDESVDILSDYVDALAGMMVLYGIRNEFEAYSGNFTTGGSVDIRGKLNQDVVQKRVLYKMLALRRDFQKRVFLTDDQSERKSFSEEEKMKVSAIYILSYYNQKSPREKLVELGYEKFIDKLDVLNFGKFSYEEKRIYGLPWYVFCKVLVSIRKELLEQENPQEKKFEQVKEDSEEEYI